MHLDQGALEDARATFERALEDVERHAVTAATDPQPDAVAYRAQRTSRASLLQGLAAVLERQGYHAASLRRYREAEQETARVRDVVAREATRDETLAQFESRVALAVLFSRVTTLLMQARLGEGEGAEAELREIFQSLIKTRADPSAVIALGMRIAALDASRGDWESVNAVAREVQGTRGGATGVRPAAFPRCSGP